MITLVAVIGLVACLWLYKKSHRSSWLSSNMGYYLLLLAAPLVQLPIEITFIILSIFSLVSLYHLVLIFFRQSKLAPGPKILVLINLTLFGLILFA